MEVCREELQEEWRPYLRLDVNDLSQAHSLEMVRRNAILEKAKANLTGLAICMTLVFAGVGWIWVDKESPVPSCIASNHVMGWLLLTAIVYILIALLCAFRAIRVDRWHDLWLQAVATPLKVEDPASERSATLIQIIHLNQAMNLILSGYVITSHTCMRNGFMALSAFIICIVISWLL